jgi:hypothetical protein
MDEIARSVVVSESEDDLTASELLTKAKERIASDVMSQEEYLAFGYDEVANALPLLALTELAIRCRYVHLNEWSETPLLESVARAVAPTDNEVRSGPIDQLIRELVARFDDQSPAVISRNDDAFHAFESYLQLTATITHDRQVRAVANYLRQDWMPADDEGLLTSPEAFAQALARRRVGDAPTSDVAAMLRLIHAMEWLSEILERVERYDDISQRMLGFAEWSADAWIVSARSELWAQSMSEWLQPRDREAEEAWREFRSSVFPTIELRQWDLGLVLKDENRFAALQSAIHQYWVDGHYEVPGDEVDDRVVLLLREGRSERARRTICAALEELSRNVRIEGNKRPLPEIQTMLRYASRLAKLGDPASAAAFIAPVVDRLVGLVGPDDSMVQEAIAFVAAARGLSPTAQSGATPSEAVSTSQTEMPTESAYDRRSGYRSLERDELA